MAGFDLISKCSKAVEREDLGNLTPQDFEKAIDYAAKALAKSSGKNISLAYTKLLGTPFGKRLYTGRQAACVAKVS